MFKVSERVVSTTRDGALSCLRVDNPGVLVSVALCQRGSLSMRTLRTHSAEFEEAGSRSHRPFGSPWGLALGDLSTKYEADPRSTLTLCRVCAALRRGGVASVTFWGAVAGSSLRCAGSVRRYVEVGWRQQCSGVLLRVHLCVVPGLCGVTSRWGGVSNFLISGVRGGAVQVTKPSSAPPHTHSQPQVRGHLLMVTSPPLGRSPICPIPSADSAVGLEACTRGEHLCPQRTQGEMLRFCRAARVASKA